MLSRIVLVLTLASSVRIAAPVPVQARVQEKEKAVPSSPDYSKEAYVIEKLEKRVTEEADGSGTRELSAEVKILAEAGVKAFAVLSFTYTSANEVVDVDYVRVRKPDGTVIKTPDYNVQDMPAEVTRSASMYSDVHEKHVAVKGSRRFRCRYSTAIGAVKPEVPWPFLVRGSSPRVRGPPKGREARHQRPRRQVCQGGKVRSSASGLTTKADAGFIAGLMPTLR